MSTLDKTIINIKINKALKREAQALADEIGIPLTTVITANIKEFVRSRSLTMSAWPRLKPVIEKEIGKAISDYKKGEHVSGVLSTEDEIAVHLKYL